VGVPRLNGARMGVLATRTPHRPVPLGLSLAKVESIRGRTLIISGADLVDGTPVMDIKPYIPFVEALKTATCPPWVNAEGPDNEPLHIAKVLIGQSAEEQIRDCWSARQSQSMYSTAEEYLHLVRQALARDIRSVHQRSFGKQAKSEEGCKSHAIEGISAQRDNASSCDKDTLFHIILEWIDISYEMLQGSVVHVVGATTIVPNERAY
ncbi:hypothetical protein CYMTET_35764, partial [Cymbomonas tetramitiformis]